MSGRRLTVVLALAALALGAPSAARAADCPGADAVPAADNLVLVGRATLCLVNDQRTSHGRRALTTNAALTTASSAYSQRMVQQAFFAHESPDGGNLVARLKGARYLTGGDDWVVGENIGWGQGPLATPQSMVTAWMNSAGHRANILSREYREIGFGLALGAPADSTWGATYTTDFGDRGTPPSTAKGRAAAATAARRRAAAQRKHRRAMVRSACARAAKARSAQAHNRGRAPGRASKTCARLALV
jgi:hypothetical protein